MTPSMTRPMTRATTRRRGFTLIEVMVAVAILAIVTTLTWTSFKQTIATKSAIEGQAGRYRTVRLALDRMARELSMAYVSQNEDVLQQERRTRFVGKPHGDVDEVTFSYFGHQRLYQDANECDTALVSYYASRDRNDSRKTNLIRRETRRLSNLRIEEQAGEADIVCDDVVKLKLQYWDERNKEWREDWATTSGAAQVDRLPGKIRITLTVHDERGVEVPFQTQVKVAMSEPLSNAPQNLIPTGVGQPPVQQQRTGADGKPLPPPNPTPGGGQPPFGRSPFGAPGGAPGGFPPN
jgi:general secretion pathway protein J